MQIAEDWRVGAANPSFGVPVEVDEADQLAYRAELRAIHQSRWAWGPLGLLVCAALVAAVAWPTVEHGRLTAWFTMQVVAVLFMAINAKATDTLPPDPSGLPYFSRWAALVGGVTVGLTPWIDLDGLENGEFRYIAFVALIAISAGTQFLATNATGETIWILVPIWVLAIPAYALVGDWYLVAGLVFFGALAVRNYQDHHASIAAGSLARHRLRREAVSDPLTGLPNRAGLIAELESRKDDDGLIVMFIDLDRFKQVNDRFGHRAGDELLCHVANRIRVGLRDADVVGRLGGDEFVAILGSVGSFSVEGVAERIIRAIEQPIEIALGGGTASDGDTSAESEASPGTPERVPLWVSASIGIAAAGGIDAESLLGRADRALYVAKGRGGRRAVTYEADLGEALDASGGLEMALRRAVLGGQLETVGQPVFEVRTGRMLGVELLSRWSLEDGTEVPPSRFIPLAEQLGLIDEIGRQVLDRAIGQIRAWSEHPELSQLGVGVNISPVHLASGRLSIEIVELLERYCVPPDRLRIEITDHGSIDDDPETLIRSLKRIRSIGVAIIIDDFGTGFSSIGRLASLAVDAVKVDRSLIADVGDDARRIAALRAAHDLALALGRSVIAEGVESTAELQLVHDVGFTTAQGFGFCRPLPLAELTERHADVVEQAAAFGRSLGDRPTRIRPHGKYEPAPVSDS